MENVPTQPQPEQKHYTVRFSAIGELSHAALALLTEEAHQDELDPMLYVRVPKYIEVTPSSVADGFNKSEHEFGQYRRGMEYFKNTTHQFQAAPEIFLPKNVPVINSVRFLLTLDPESARRLISLPLYNPRERSVGQIKVHYNIPNPAQDMESRLKVFRRALKNGMFFDEPALVEVGRVHPPSLLRPTPERDPLLIQYLNDEAKKVAPVINLDEYRRKRRQDQASHPDTA